MNDIRVLIVEDDARIADLHRRFTERVEGYAVVGVALGLAEAADMVASLGPDLVLLDLYFPEGNGMGLLREIRSRCLETDVILITAAREVGPLKDALRHGVCDYIIKPVMAGRFHECLEKYRRRRLLLSGAGAVDQGDVDRLLRGPAAAGVQDHAAALPKGIDALTLDKVQAVFGAEDAVRGLSAEEVGARIGASRSTARRYLEYLVSVGSVFPDVAYGSVGRPERRYFRA